MRKQLFATMVLVTAVSSQLVYATIEPVPSTYPAPFMLTDMRDINYKSALEVKVTWQTPGTKKGQPDVASATYSGGGPDPSGGVSWPSDAKQLQASFEWATLIDPKTSAEATEASVSIKGSNNNNWQGDGAKCFQGNQIMTITGNSKDSSVTVACSTVPACSSGQGVTMASGKTYCAP